MMRVFGRRASVLALGAVVLVAVGAGVAQVSSSRGDSGATTPEAKQVMDTLLLHENEASSHRGHYVYASEERSDRTGGRLWSERVAETNWGKVKYLLAVDGQPLEGDRLAAEKARVADEAAHPDEFKQKEAARLDDEQHAKQMLALLPKAFLFDTPVAEGEALRIRFRPNPGYTPQGMEERVLHAMNGSVLIDRKLVRLREIAGTIPQDVNIGFGLLATIHAGSNFSTVRGHLEGVDWKTQQLHTDIRGKALFLKTIARQQESKHTAFRKIADDMSVTDAVALLEHTPSVLER